MVTAIPKQVSTRSIRNNRRKQVYQNVWRERKGTVRPQGLRGERQEVKKQKSRGRLNLITHTTEKQVYKSTQDAYGISISFLFLPLSQGMPAHCLFYQDNPSSWFELYHSGTCNSSNQVTWLVCGGRKHQWRTATEMVTAEYLSSSNFLSSPYSGTKYSWKY